MTNPLQADIADIGNKYGTKILDIKQTADYLSVEPADILQLFQDGSLQSIGKSQKVLVAEIARFINGIPCDNVPKNPPQSLGNITIDTTAGSAVQFPQFNEEDYKMSELQYGQGSVYYSPKSNCWNGAFYILDESQTKKRKIVSAKTREEVLHKMDVCRQAFTMVPRNRDIAPKLPTPPPSPQSVTNPITFKAVFEEYWEFWNAKDRADSTKIERESMYQNLILPSFGDLLIGDIRPVDVQRFLNNVTMTTKGKLRSSTSIQKLYTNVKAVFLYARENSYILKTPTYGIDVPQGAESDRDGGYLSQEDIVKVLHDLRNSPKYTMMIWMLLATGLRPQEFLVLRWSNIDFENNTMKIKKALTKERNPIANVKPKYVYVEGATKTKESVRTIYMSDTLAETLKQWKDLLLKQGIFEKAMHNGNADYIILDSNANLFGYNSLVKNLHKYLRNNGTSGVVPNLYSLRHSFATYMNAIGVAESIISDQMGHTTGQASITRKVYISNLAENYTNAAKSYDGFLKSIQVDLERIA